MGLDIGSFYEARTTRVLTTKRFSVKVNEKQQLIEKNGKLLVKQTKKGTVNEIKETLEKNISGLRHDNDFCLVFSATNGYYHIVKILIEYGYLNYIKINKNIKLCDILLYSIEWSAKNGHLKTLIYLIDVVKSQNQLDFIKDKLEKMILKNYNSPKDFSSLLKNNENNIKKSKEIIKKNNEFNKFNNRNKPANISIFDELMLNASNDHDNEIGVDYNEMELDLEENSEDENSEDEEIIVEDEIEPVEEELVDEENEIEDNFDDEDLFGEEENEPVEELSKKINKTSYTSTFFKKQKANLVYLDGVKTDKNQRIEVILWLIKQDYLPNTNYYFISRYITNNKMKDIIDILKSKGKYLLEIDDVNFELLNIENPDTIMKE